MAKHGYSFTVLLSSKSLAMIRQIFLNVSLCLLLCTGYCQTATEWQGDLRYLQQTVHSKYSNLFYNISAADWDKAVDNFNNQIPKLNKEQVLAGFVRLVALFHIGHTQMNTFGLHQQVANGLSLHRFPFQLYWFNDGLYFLQAESKYANAVSGKVTRIGTMKTDAALEAIRPLVSYENEQGYRSNAVFYLANPGFKDGCFFFSVFCVSYGYFFYRVGNTLCYQKFGIC